MLTRFIIDEVTNLVAVVEYFLFLPPHRHLGTPTYVCVSPPHPLVIFTSEELELLFSTNCLRGLRAANLFFRLKILTWNDPLRNLRKLCFEIFLGLALTGMKGLVLVEALAPIGSLKEILFTSNMLINFLNLANAIFAFALMRSWKK